MEDFIHLHVHTYYSILDGQSKIKNLVDKAIGDGMKGMAITDHGDMFGIKEFHDYCISVNKNRKKDGLEPFKPIFGCEMYVARHGPKEQKNGKQDQSGYHLIVLAKNYNGYKNLIKLVSNSWVDGYYMRPRTDRADLEKYHEALKAGLPLHINIAFREPLYTDAGRDIPLLDKTDAGLETFLSEARKRTGETLPSAIPATDISYLYSARNIKAGTAFKGTFFLNCHLLKLPFLQKILNRREKESRNPSVVITDAALSELSAECLEPEHRDAGTGRGIKIRPFSGKYGAVAFACGLSSRKHPVIVILTADNLIKDLSSLILLREYGITVVILSSNDDLKDDFPDIKIFAAGLGVPFLRFSISYDEAASGAGSIESAPLTLSPENSIPDINSSTSEAQIIEYRKVNQK